MIILDRDGSVVRIDQNGPTSGRTKATIDILPRLVEQLGDVMHDLLDVSCDVLRSGAVDTIPSGSEAEGGLLCADQPCEQRYCATRVMSVAEKGTNV